MPVCYIVYRMPTLLGSLPRILAFTVSVSATLACGRPTELPRQLAVPPSFLGYTQCEETAIGKTRIVDPASWLNLRVRGTAEENPTAEHEAVHQKQMRRFTSCRAAYDWYRENTIEAEAEAFCTSARVFARENPSEATLDGAVWKYAKWLTNYDASLSHGRAIIHIKEFCSETKETVRQ